MYGQVFSQLREKKALCFLPQKGKKNHLFYLCKYKLSRVVVNSGTQGQ